MERKAFNALADHCVKCGGFGDSRHYGGYPQFMGVSDEWLTVTCLHCGYEYEMDVKS